MEWDDYCVIYYKVGIMAKKKKMLKKLFKPSLKPFISGLFLLIYLFFWPSLSSNMFIVGYPLNFNKWQRIFLFLKLYFSSCHCFINQEEAF